MAPSIQQCPTDAPLTRIEDAQGNPIRAEADLIAAKKALQGDSPTPLPEEAICAKQGDYYVNLSEYSPLQNLSTRPQQQTRREYLIDQIRSEEVTLGGYEKLIPELRKELADALKGLKDLHEQGLKSAPLKDLLWNMGRNAVMFGLVTGAFHDVAVAAATYSQWIQQVYSLFAEQLALKEMAKAKYPCGPEEEMKDLKPTPPQLDFYKQQLQKTWKPFLALGALVLAGIQLDDWRFKKGEQKRLQALSQVSPADPHGFLKIGHDMDELNAMNEDQLGGMLKELQQKVQARKREQTGILQEIRKAYEEIYVSHLGELQRRDLEAIEDPQLKEKAKEIIKTKTPLEGLSILTPKTGKEVLEIGGGFGIGTLVLGKWYVANAPWSVRLGRRLEAIQRQATQNAKGAMFALCLEEAARRVPVISERRVDLPHPSVSPASQAATVGVGVAASLPWYSKAWKVVQPHAEWAGYGAAALGLGALTVFVVGNDAAGFVWDDWVAPLSGSGAMQATQNFRQAWQAAW